MGFPARRERPTAGSVEGLNFKVKLAVENAYGFGSFRASELALFHKRGDLPASGRTHRIVRQGMKMKIGWKQYTCEKKVDIAPSIPQHDTLRICNTEKGSFVR